MLMSLQRAKRLALEPHAPGQRQRKRDAGPKVLKVWKDMLGPAPSRVDDDTIRFTISTPGIDRAMDTVSLTGWVLDAYRLSPVVLWAHDTEIPAIGRCTDIGPDAGALKANVRFDPADEFAMTIRRKCLDGYISTTSVGFRPIDFDVTDDPARGADDWFPGFDFTRQELTEFSIVNVPCNAECLIDPGHRIDPADPLADLLSGVSAGNPAGVLRRLRAFDRLAPG